MLALTQDAAEAIIGMTAIVIGFAVCIGLWWGMVFRPSREERRQRERDAGED